MNAEQSTFSVDEKRTALRLVLESKTFARADQLKHFLSYVCEMEFAGRGAEINEYAIGTEALGRPKEYSPQDDSTVRSRAYSLRQKLREYYEKERPDSTLRIELHKGSYAPLFVAMPLAMSSRSDSSRSRWHGWILPLLLGAALASGVWLIAASLLTPKPPRTAIDPIVFEAWGPLTYRDAHVALSLGSPPHIHLRSFGGPGRPSHEPPLLDAPAEVADFYRNFRLAPPDSPVFMYRTSNSLLLGDALAAANAVRMLTAMGASFELLPEKVAGHIALRGRNVMRFGSSSDSREVARELSRAAFTIRYDPSIPDEVISDKPPGTQGARVFRPERVPGGANYGLLTVMPTEDGGTQRRTVVASGIGSPGAQAAIEFFSSPQHLKALKDRFRAQGFSTFPLGYQVILKYMSGNNMVASYSYETHVILR